MPTCICWEFPILREHVTPELFAREINQQVQSLPGHWHHYYTEEELVNVLAWGIGASGIDIAEVAGSLYVTFGKGLDAQFGSERARELGRGLMAWTNPLPNVPLIESPLYQKIHDAGFFGQGLAAELASQLHEDGFAVFEFPEDRFSELADEVIASLDSGL